MMIRLVDMEFRPEERLRFLQVFDESKSAIASFPGCLRLELINDKSNPNRFCTYSYWDKEESLENYRNSDLFKSTWSKTKPLFSRRAEASSFDRKFLSDERF